jgi:hypothetical protein
MVGDLDLVVVHEDTPVAYDIMGQVIAPMHGALVADIARNDAGHSDTGGDHHIMVFQHHALQSAYSHEAREFAIAYQRGVERVPDEDLAPVGATVAVLDEYLDVQVVERAIRVQRLPVLDVAEAILALPGTEIAGRYEGGSQDGLGMDKDVVHDGLPDVQ